MINKEMLDTLLLYHEEKNRDLIRNQAAVIGKLIDDNISKYNSSKDYRDGVDDVLKLVLQGSFTGGELDEN